MLPVLDTISLADMLAAVTARRLLHSGFHRRGQSGPRKWSPLWWVLNKGGVEIPSDYQGVLYVELDGKGAWRTRLAQELSNAGLKINLEALLKS